MKRLFIITAALTLSIGAAAQLPSYDTAPLGLAPNVSKAQPSGVTGKTTEYSCWGYYEPRGTYSKTFFKGTNARINNYDSDGHLTDYMIFLVPEGDPMKGAAYMVRPKEKTIMKLSFAKMKGQDKSATPILNSIREKDLGHDRGANVVKYRGRWCVHETVTSYYEEKGMENIRSRSDYQVVDRGTSASEERSWTDCETGIQLRYEDICYFDIQIGPQSDNLFRIPEDYKIIDAMDMMENQMGDWMDKIGGFNDAVEKSGLKDAKNMSTEELLRLLQ